MREGVKLYSSVSDFLFADLEEVASLPCLPGVEVGGRSVAKMGLGLWSLRKALEAQLGTRNVP